MRQPLPSGAWTSKPGIAKTLTITVVSVLAAACLTVLSFYLATRQTDSKPKPFIVGYGPVLRKDIAEKGPQYESDATGRSRGMWLDLSKGKLVAFAAETSPGSGCDITWRRTRYVELCNESTLKTVEMQQFKLTERTGGDTDGAMVVDPSSVITP
ncbi:MAG: hypothetical protein WBD02_06595 [Acidimicrobiia bacterium]